MEISDVMDTLGITPAELGRAAMRSFRAALVATVKAKGEDSPGGKKITKQERRAIAKAAGKAFERAILQALGA